MAEFRVKTPCGLTDYLTGTGYSRTKVRQLLKYNAIEVNGKVLKDAGHLLVEGDIVSVRRQSALPKPAPSSGIRIVYEDNALIVIEKPAGLLTIASETEKTRTAYYQLNDFLKLRDTRAHERIFIVHRLDRDTSGLIVFAKNEVIKRALQRGWNKVEKRYYALVEGIPERKEGKIASRLKETKSLKVFSNLHSEDAKPAVTRYRVLRQKAGYSLLDVLLETGRKNQIRVHLADIGHPVAGDRKYGAKTDPLGRLGLHAYLLSFEHPDSGEPMRFESKMPGTWKAFDHHSPGTAGKR